MLVIENCNSLSELRQKFIDGEEVRTVRQEPCEDAIRREDAINAVSEALEHVFVEHEDIAKKIINKLPSVTPQPKTEYISIDDVMSVFNDYMCGDVNEDDTNTFLTMLIDKAESEEV